MDFDRTPMANPPDGTFTWDWTPMYADGTTGLHRMILRPDRSIVAASRMADEWLVTTIAPAGTLTGIHLDCLHAQWMDWLIDFFGEDLPA